MPTQSYKPEPFESKTEALEHAGKMSAQVADMYGIPYEEAARRVAGLIKSGILETGSPDSPKSQLAISAFLSIPSSTYAHLG